MLCVSTCQVMGQQWLEREGSSWVRSCSCLAAIPNPCTRQGWVLGFSSHLRAAGAGSLASSQPADGAVSQPVLILLPLLPGALCPSGVAAVAQLTPSPPLKEVQQSLMALLAGPKDSHTISVHWGKGLLLSHCNPMEQHFSHELHAHIHMVRWKPRFSLKEEKFLQTKSPHSCKNHFENTKWDPGHPAEAGWGQWDLAWQWDTHGGGWWWLFPAHGLSYSWKLHCCDRVSTWTSTTAGTNVTQIPHSHSWPIPKPTNSNVKLSFNDHCITHIPPAQTSGRQILFHLWPDQIFLGVSMPGTANSPAHKQHST